MFDVDQRRPRAIPARTLASAALVLRAALATAQSPTSAPTPDSLKIGAHVRGVTSADGVRIEGFFRAADAASLRIGTCKHCDASPAIPLSSLRYLQVEQRRHTISAGEAAGYLIVGTFLGAAAGGITGAAVAYHQVHQPNCGDLCGLNWLLIPYLGAAGAATGFVAGGGFAVTHHESYWVGVRLPVPAR